MKTYAIPEQQITERRARSVRMPLILGGLTAFFCLVSNPSYWAVGLGIGTAIAALLFAAEFRGATAWARWAREHQLTLEDAALVLSESDGRIEIPYQSISGLVVNQKGGAAAELILVLGSGGRRRLPAYHDLPGLLEELVNRLDQPTVSYRRFLHA